jgi:hypothetical protein
MCKHSLISLQYQLQLLLWLRKTLLVTIHICGQVLQLLSVVSWLVTCRWVAALNKLQGAIWFLSISTTLAYTPCSSLVQYTNLLICTLLVGPEKGRCPIFVPVGKNWTPHWLFCTCSSPVCTLPCSSHFLLAWMDSTLSYTLCIYVSMPMFPVPFTSLWGWRQHGSLKWWYCTTLLHGITNQKTVT